MDFEPSVEVGRMHLPGAEWSFCEPEQTRRRPVSGQSSESSLGNVLTAGRRPLQLDALQAQADTIHRQLQQTNLRRSAAAPVTLKQAAPEGRTRYSLQSLPSVDLMSAPVGSATSELCLSPPTSQQTQHSWQSEYDDLDLGEALHLSHVIQSGLPPEPTASSTSTQDTTFFQPAAAPPTPDSTKAVSASLLSIPTGRNSTTPTSAPTAAVPAPTSTTAVAGLEPLTRQGSLGCNGSNPAPSAAPAPLPSSAAALRSSTTSTGALPQRAAQAAGASVPGRGRQGGSQAEWQEKMSAGLSELSQILKTSKGTRASVLSLPNTGFLAEHTNDNCDGGSLVDRTDQPAASSTSVASDQTTARYKLMGSPQQDSGDTSGSITLARTVGSPMELDQEVESCPGPATRGAAPTSPSADVKPVVKESNALQAAKMLRRSWAQPGTVEPSVWKGGWAAAAEPPSSPTLGSSLGESLAVFQTTSNSLPSYVAKSEEVGENTAISKPSAGALVVGGRERSVSKDADSCTDSADAQAEVQQRRAAARAETERLVMETALMFQFRGTSLGAGSKLDASTMTSGSDNFRSAGLRSSRAGLHRPLEGPAQDPPTTLANAISSAISKDPVGGGSLSTPLAASSTPNAAVAATTIATTSCSQPALASEDVDMMDLDADADADVDAADKNRITPSNTNSLDVVPPAAGFASAAKPPSGAAAVHRTGSSTPRLSLDLTDVLPGSSLPPAPAPEPVQPVRRPLSLTNTHSTISSSESFQSLPSSTSRSLAGIPSPQLVASPLVMSPRRTSSDDGSATRIKPPTLSLRGSLTEPIGADAGKASSSSLQEQGAVSARSRIPSGVATGKMSSSASPAKAASATKREDTVGPLKAGKIATPVRASWTEGMAKRPVSASAASVPRPTTSTAPGVIKPSSGEKATERGEIPRVRARKVWGEATPPPNLSLLPSPPSTPLTSSLSQFSLTPRSETRSNGRISAPPSRSDTPSRLEALFTGGSVSTAIEPDNAVATISASLLRRSLSSTSDTSDKDIRLRRSSSTTPASIPSTPSTPNLTPNLVPTIKKSSSTVSTPSPTASKTSKANQKPTPGSKVSRSLSLSSKNLTAPGSETLRSPITRSMSGMSTSSTTSGPSTAKPEPLKSPATAGISGSSGSGTINGTNSSISKYNNSATTKSGVAVAAKKNSGGNRVASSVVVDKQAQATITLGPGGRGPATVDMQVREIPVPSSGVMSSIAKLRAGSANKLPLSKKDAAAGSDKPVIVRASLSSDVVPSQAVVKNSVPSRNNTARGSSVPGPAAAKADKEPEAQKRRPAPRKAVAPAEPAPVAREKSGSSTNGSLPKPSTVATAPAKRSASPAPSIKRAPSPTPSKRAVSPALSVSSRMSDIMIMQSKEREGSVMDCMWLMLYDGMTVISRSAPLLAPKGRGRTTKPPAPANIFAKWLGTSLLPMIPDSSRTDELLATEVPEVYRSKTGKKLATVDMIVNHLQDCWFGLKPVPNTTTARLSLSLRASFQPPTANAAACIRVVKNGKDCPADGTTSWLADYTVPGLMYMSAGQLQAPTAADVLANAKLLSAWTVD